MSAQLHFHLLFISLFIYVTARYQPAQSTAQSSDNKTDNGVSVVWTSPSPIQPPNSKTTEPGRTLATQDVYSQATPEFLEYATDSQRKDYVDIESNTNIPIDEMRKAEDAWATKCGEPVLSLYKAYQKEQKKKRREEEKRIDEIVKTLSPAAQKADKIIRGIYNNGTLTRKEMDHAIEVQLSKLDKETYNELVLATQ